MPQWQLHVDLLGSPQDGVPTGVLSMVKRLHSAVKHRLFGHLYKVSRFAIQDPWDLLGDPQQLVGTLGAVPGEPGKAPQGVFSCAICFDEHSLEDCYIASMCGHRMCRDAAREVVLGAVRCASGSGTYAGMYVISQMQQASRMTFISSYIANTGLGLGHDPLQCNYLELTRACTMALQF